MECTICVTPMGVPSFTAVQQEDAVEGENCRLKCGHAFHTSCILTSFRYNPMCPCCRSGEKVIIRFGDDSDSDYDSSVTVENDGFQTAATQLHTIRRTDEEVKEIRKEYATQKQAYTAYCQTLAAKKKALLKLTMQQFRKDHFKEHRAHFRSMKTTLVQMKSKELQSITTRFGNQASLAVAQHFKSSYEPVIALLNCTTSKSFWMR